MTNSTRVGVVGYVFSLAAAAGIGSAQEIDLPSTIIVGKAARANARPDDSPASVLSAPEWARVDAAVDRALAWLAMQQQPDGSFPTMDTAQPAVTSLCVLAFMAQGHNPSEGPYGERLDRAVDFVMSHQKQNGLITLYGPEGPTITRDVSHEIGYTAAYNHAISGLTLSEIYGMGQTKRAEKMEKVITKALRAALEMQGWAKQRPFDQGGWRYVDDFDESDSDLSVTGWYLMFLRSARNAGFNVPKQSIDNAVGYVRRSFDKRFGTFTYTINRGDTRSRGMAGAGILALGHAGFHHSFEAQRTGQWIMQYSFEVYNSDGGFQRDRYHYSLFNCCQGMYQLGSPYWEQFFPRTVRAVLANQQAEGSWDAESFHRDRVFGNSYTTALVLLAIGAPNQLLPVFQR